MTRPLLMLLSLLVQVYFTESGGHTQLQINPFDYGERKGRNEIISRERNDRADDQVTERLAMKDVEITEMSRNLEVMKIEGAQWKDEAVEVTQADGAPEGQIHSLEIIKYKKELKAAEIEVAKWWEISQWWKDEAIKLKEIVKSREVEIETLKRREKSLGWRYLEYQHRAAIQKVEMETRIQMLNEELLKQTKLGQQREIAAKWREKWMRKDNQKLEKQLVEARRHQEICVPDSPIHKQDGPWCLNFSTATWMRKTLTNQFFLTLPAHNKIVRNIGKQSSNEVGVGPGGFYAQMECIKKEAARWNLEVVELNVWKEGGFDRAHEHLKKGYALWWALQPREWGPIKEHISKSSYGYLGQYEWAAIKHLVAADGHGMVITQYIEPGAGKPGFYRIKNSHGENGGSHGQKGYVLIVDKVLREIKPQYVYVATPKNFAAEAFGGGGK